MTDKPTVPLDLATLSFESVDVLSLAKELLGSEHAVRDGRAARTLAKGHGLTAVLTVVPAGGNLGEHLAPGPVVIIPIVGTATFSGGKDRPEAYSISVGQTLFVGEGQKHQVSANEDCAFLILIGLRS
jgi:quercetin dioxygenase-like cupin family protein